MRADYFALFKYGIVGELGLLDTQGILKYIQRYNKLFMMEGPIASACANALARHNDFEKSTSMQDTFLHCLNRAHHAMPLHLDILNILNSISPKQERNLQQDILAQLALSAESAKRVDAILGSESPEEIYAPLLQSLHENPAGIGAAQALLRADFICFRQPEAWLHLLQCPKRLQPLWRMELFLHYARRGMATKALPIWETLPQEAKSPYAAVYAADMYALAGDITTALSLYRHALAADPDLDPVRRRISDIQSPPVLRPELLHERKTAICLYSWNKGPMLAQTLRALACTDTGNCPIFVLLNGCSDDSEERVLALRGLFPGREFEIINLPVNVGAPAARNWLISLPQVQASDYVAFMDDDVVMPKDWLVRYLTEMERDEKNGVVGGKVLFPAIGEDAPVIQYLYRTVTITVQGALKLNSPSPLDGLRDTGLYSFSRPCIDVMGCLHLLRVSALREVGDFDLRFSPSQVDDIDHDLCTCLKGYKVIYCGGVACEHHQNSGVGAGKAKGRLSAAAIGSIIGNDLKLNYKHLENLDALNKLADKCG